jgi:Tol biopolymer transport system component
MEEHPGVESCLSPDGKRLFFVRTFPGSEEFEHDIYVAVRTGDVWDLPQRLTETELGKRRISPSVARSGSLYFSGDYDQPGQKDIYCSRFENGRYMEPVNLGPAVNSDQHEEHVFVSADESFILFDSYRPNKNGRTDIYISFRLRDGKWTRARNLGPLINSEFSDWYPSLTPDGKYLLFARTKPGMKIDIYWADASMIKTLAVDNKKKE